MHFIIFDLDGTLCQSYYSDDNSYLKALNQIIDIDVNYAYWKECPHLTDRAVLNYIFQKQHNRLPTEVEVQHMKALFIDQLRIKQQKEPHFFHPIPGAVEFVQHLNSHHENIRIGVATGGWKDVARFKLNLIGLSKGDYYLIGSDDHDAKHDFVSALIQQAQTDENKPFQQITYVGDSLYDLRAAKALNINFVGIDYKQNGHFQKNGHYAVVEHFIDIPSVLSHLRIDHISGSNLTIN